MNENNIIISCKDAKLQGLKFYYNGIPCKSNNLDYRQVNNSKCRCNECMIIGRNNSNKLKKEHFVWTRDNAKSRAKGTKNNFDDRHKDTVIKICEEKKYIFHGLVGVYKKTSNTFLKLECIKHKRTWETTVMSSFFSGVGCKKCATDNAIAARTNPKTSEYKKYLSKVQSHTRKQDVSALDHFDKPRTLCGVEGGYQLDHIISVKIGFVNNIPPEVIGNINNLQFLPWKQNRDKWHK